MKNINAFIQDLEDTTTVLQQLQVCIKQIKECINEITNIGTLYVHNVKLINASYEFVTLTIINSDSTEYTLDTIKEYLTNNTTACNGLVDVATPRIAYEITYIEGSTYTVEGSNTDLSDNGTTEVAFTYCKDTIVEV